MALLVGLIAEVVATLLLGYTGAAFDWLFVLIFSGYIGYDIAKSQAYPKTVDIAFRFSDRGWSEWPLTADKYLFWLKDAAKKDDIINLFIRLLSILSRRD